MKRRPAAKPAFAQWIESDLWTIVDAAQLLVGLEPTLEVITDPWRVRDSIASEDQRSRYVHTYKALKDATSLYNSNPEHEKGLAFIGPIPLPNGLHICRRRVEPEHVIEWARRKRFDIPPELDTAFPSRPPAAKPVETRERDTLLIIIAALARKATRHSCAARARTSWRSIATNAVSCSI